jgi:uncharacterized membrane protein YphA (DoxX/SURF4 family)
MAVLRRIARPLLASMFVSGGYEQVRDPAHLLPAAKPVVEPVSSTVAPRTSLLPENPEQLVRINGAVQLGAGVLLALGRAPRLASLALAVTLVPTTLAAHRFWEEEDPERRAAQRVEFLKNVSMLGGLLLAAADTHGKPSLAYRTRGAAGHAGDTVAHRAHAAADLLGGAASGVTDALGGAAGDVAHAVRDVTGTVAHAVQDATGTVAHTVGEAAGTVAHGAGDIAGTVAGTVAGGVTDAADAVRRRLH